MQDCVLQLLCSTLISLKMCSHSVCACIGVGSGRAMHILPILQHTIILIKIKTWLIKRELCVCRALLLVAVALPYLLPTPLVCPYLETSCAHALLLCMLVNVVNMCTHSNPVTSTDRVLAASVSAATPLSPMWLRDILLIVQEDSASYICHPHTYNHVHTCKCNRARSQLVAVSPHTGCTNVGMEPVTSCYGS